MVIKEGKRERGERGEGKRDGWMDEREENKLRKTQIHQLYSSPFTMIPLSNHGYKGHKKKKTGTLACERHWESDYVSRKPKSSDFQGYLTSIQMATKAWLSC